MNGRLDRSRPHASIWFSPTSDLYSSEDVFTYCGVNTDLPMFEAGHAPGNLSFTWAALATVQVTVVVRPCSTRNMTMNTGICSSSGKHEASGLTLCSW